MSVVEGSMVDKGFEVVKVIVEVVGRGGGLLVVMEGEMLIGGNANSGREEKGGLHGHNGGRRG